MIRDDPGNDLEFCRREPAHSIVHVALVACFHGHEAGVNVVILGVAPEPVFRVIRRPTDVRGLKLWVGLDAPEKNAQDLLALVGLRGSLEISGLQT